jgi:metallophosphoesterase superfamily enzyme
MLPTEEIDRRYLLRNFSGQKIFIASDLHLGFEEEWVQKGLNTRPPSWTFQVIDMLHDDLMQTQPDILLILGDFEHSFPHFREEGGWVSNKWQNERILEYLIGKIKSLDFLKQILLVRGNQDTLLLKSLQIHLELIPSKGAALFHNELGAFHGHVTPDPEIFFTPEIVLGHIHPSIELTDELGIKHKLPVFVKLSLPREEIFKLFKFPIDLEDDVGLIDTVRMTILPAYNPFLGGFPLNKPRKRASNRPSYPVLQRLLQHPRLRVQMTNGVDLGELQNFK